jgi:hypothetical protein
MTKLKRAYTTLFWCGEAANADNKEITNIESYWCNDWVSCFGGVDHPQNRRGFYPADFTPKENPFYFALPFGEFNDKGTLKNEAKDVPWFQEGLIGGSLLKNRWIEVRYKDRVVYAQWEDVGPFGEADFDYVFGSASIPKNRINNNAGLDLSPACWMALELKDNDVTEWRFVKADAVSAGPWTEIVSTSGVDWKY